MGLQARGLVKGLRGMEDRALGGFRTLQEWSYIREPEMKRQYSSVQLTPEQEREIDRLYVENYGKKVPYHWHRLYTAYTGHFDPAYFAELLFTPRFERFENLWSNYVRVLPDKNLVPLLAAKSGIRTPEVVLSRTKGMFRDGEFRPLSPAKALELLRNAGEVFVKPTIETNSGRGCFVACFENGADQRSGERAEAILERLGTDFVMQERVVCHESIRKLYAGSVNTFRVMTYRWKDELLLAPVIMRIGCGGSVVDNAGAGGVFIGVENDGRLTGQAFNESCVAFERHPDTGTVFEGHAFPGFSRVLDAAKRMHGLVPQLGVINWDFTLGASGEPVLIEMNSISAGIFMPQMAHGKGLFGENTAEVLRWIRLMEHTKPADREKYAFGKGV